MVHHDVDRKHWGQLREGLPIARLELKEANTSTERRHESGIDLQHVELRANVVHGILAVQVKPDTANTTFVKPVQLVYRCVTVYYGNAMGHIRVQLLYERLQRPIIVAAREAVDQYRP